VADYAPGVRFGYNKAGQGVIYGLYGAKGAIKKLQRLGMEQKEFGRINKIAATIVANNAKKIAPVDSGALIKNIKPYSAKKITRNNEPAKFVFGGLVIVDVKRRARRGEKALIASGEAKEIIGYGKRVSFGDYNMESGVRHRGNPYLRTARNMARPATAAMWSREIGKWLEHNGIDVRTWNRA
jgi:hypothetical protein